MRVAATYRAPAPPPTVALRDPFARNRWLRALVVLVVGGFFAAKQLEAARGLALECAATEHACVLREDYGLFTRTRRFVDATDDPIGLALRRDSPDATLVVFRARDREGLAFTRPRREADAEALLARIRRPGVPLDGAVTDDAQPASGRVLVALAAFLATLCAAGFVARVRWVEVRPSENRLVVLTRGLPTLFRVRETASAAFSDLGDLFVTEVGRESGKARVVTVRGGGLLELTSPGDPERAEVFAAALRRALENHRVRDRSESGDAMREGGSIG